MSEEQRDNAQTSEVTPDGAETTDTATPEPADGQLGDAGKRALQALRAEVKELRSKLKAIETPADAERDASESAEAPSVGASDSTPDADGERVATTADDVKPTGRMTRDEYLALSPDERAAIPRARIPFTSSGDGGAMRRAPDFSPQLSRSDLHGMTARQIDTARRNGQLRNLLSGK
ncbi:hypothetical protein ACIQ6K_33930 [Streptomyces sp. NPDC096354]|uniref:hypothetical protein n=1 Tax=Streptomyces sp. NPDC096354 TaxID=3366088 RepID=UPI00380BE10D